MHSAHRRAVRALGRRQRRPYAYARARLVGDVDEPMCALVHGKAGTGKSTVLDAISDCCRLQHCARSVLRVTHTNAAAHLIRGSTLFKAFGLPAGKARKKLHRKGLENLRKRLEFVKLVFLDEISLVGCRTLARLHNHLCAIFPERAHLRFAGFHIIFFGDFDFRWLSFLNTDMNGGNDSRSRTESAARPPNSRPERQVAVRESLHRGYVLIER